MKSTFSYSLALFTAFTINLMAFDSAEARAPAANSLRYFVSDGCSASPDKLGKSIVHCCMVHDIAYWMGGMKADKTNADQELYQCMVNSLGPQYKGLGALYRWGVGMGGSPKILVGFKNRFPWRWGYGWSEDSKFKTLSPEERHQVLMELYRVIDGLEDQERALNENNGYAWRFGSLSISHTQFQYFAQAVTKTILILEAKQ